MSLLLAMAVTTCLCGTAPALGATAAEKCQAAKVKASGKMFFDAATCHQKALQRSVPPDPVCFQRAEAKYTKAMARADLIGTCHGAVIDLQPLLDAALADLVSQIVLPCTGSLVGGSCWYLGAFGADCNTTCASAGRIYDAATASYAGSGGSDANCAAVLGALGYTFNFSFFGGGGFGCSIFTLGSTGHRDTDPTTASAASFGYARACACY